MDGTLGGGGHAALFLTAGARVLGIDRDPQAIGAARERLGESGISYLEAAYSSDAALAAIAEFGPDFILLDLGVSSHQLDQESRGFTFRPRSPLDMRMGESGPTAAALLNEANQEFLLLHLRRVRGRAPRGAAGRGDRPATGQGAVLDQR